MGEEKSSKKEKKSKKKKEEKPKEEEKHDSGDDSGEEKSASRATRGTSNVFALFNKAQIQEFKEAFTMMDQNRDGIIDESDLIAINQQLGREPDKKSLKEMLSECPGQLNFTHFLNLFGGHLHGRDPHPDSIREMLNDVPGPLNFTLFLHLFGDKLKGADPESALRDAFAMFDEEGKGVLGEEYVKDLLMNVGDQFSKDEVKRTWKEAPIEGGQLNYLKFVQIIKRGKEDDF